MRDYGASKNISTMSSKLIIVSKSDKSELERSRDELLREVEKMIKSGNEKQAIKLSEKASQLSKQLKNEEDLLIETKIENREDPLVSDLISARKNLINEVKPLVKAGKIEAAIKRVEAASIITDQLKKPISLPILEGQEQKSDFKFDEVPIKVAEEIKKPVLAPSLKEPEVLQGINFGEKIVGMLITPYKHAKYIANQPFIEEAVFIVGIFSIVSAYVSILISDITGFLIQVSSFIEYAIFIIAAFFMWIIIAGVIHNISIALGGVGEFHPQMTTLIGYSTIPILLGGLIGSLLVSYQGALFAIIAISLFWSAVIQFYGVRASHNISAAKAAVSVSIPFILWLVIFNFFTQQYL